MPETPSATFDWADVKDEDTVTLSASQVFLSWRAASQQKFERQ
jgi:hypothetical protein